ncbi:polyprenyl synthetase family protein [Georgenia sp.]
MPAPADLRNLVSTRVLEALDEHIARFAAVGEPLAEFIAPARGLLGGGKRLRAQVCAAGWAAAGGAGESVPRAVVLAGSALELFQGTALIHDDVIDGSRTRRGLPAAHRHLAMQHAEQGWLGSSADYGEAGAIVLGDLLLAVSSLEFECARDLVEPGAGRRARELYDAMSAEVALGQYLDIRSQDVPWGDSHDAMDRALTVIRHKSARYSVEHPLLIGAALAGADKRLLDALSEVGLPLGEAFQLRDDELGVFGDPAVTGKPAGDDLREGKRTVLLAMTLQRADAAQSALVHREVGRADIDEAGVLAVREVIRSTGAFEAHEELIARRRAAGLAALTAAALPPVTSDRLEELAEALTRRSA